MTRSQLVSRRSSARAGGGSVAGSRVTSTAAFGVGALLGGVLMIKGQIMLGSMVALTGMVVASLTEPKSY